jgi:hypothetical protein
MLSAQQPQAQGRAMHERGAVHCEKCRAPIYVDRPGMVSIEFCVPCPACGHRGIYYKRMLVTDAGEGHNGPR